MENLRSKLELYRKIEEKVSIKLNDYDFADYGYLLEKRVIAWGDISSFNVNGGKFHVELIAYSYDFSDMLDLEIEEIANKVFSEVVNDINNKIQSQVDSIGLESNISNFKNVIKLVLEGVNICFDDKFVCKYGIATIY